MKSRYDASDRKKPSRSEVILGSSERTPCVWFDLSPLGIGLFHASSHGVPSGESGLKVENPQIYQALAFDGTISANAFRLWHVLAQYTGEKQCAYPSIRILANDLGSCKESVMVWISDLERAGYLRVEKGHQHKPNHYFCLRKPPLGWEKRPRGRSGRTINVPTSRTESKPLIKSIESSGAVAQPLAESIKPTTQAHWDKWRADNNMPKTGI